MANTQDAKIKVDPADLTKAAQTFQTNAEKVKSLTDRMLKNVDGINSTVWSGNAHNAFKAQFDGLADDMKLMYNMINEHVADLFEMAKKYQTAEEANQQLAAKLAADVIS